jgi:hypothetical protein
VYAKARCNLALERATKLITIRHNEREAASDSNDDDVEITMALLSATD